MLSVLLVSIFGAFCAFSSCRFLGIPPSFDLIFVSLGIICFIYLLNCYTDVAEDFGNNRLRGNRVLLLVLSITSGMAVSLYLMLIHRFSYYIICLLASGILYSVKLLPWYVNNHITFIRIKDITGLKNVFVSILWSLSIFVVPSLLSKSELHWTNINIAIFVVIFLSCMFNALFTDWLDVIGDQLAKVKTVFVLNERFGKYLLYGIPVVSCLLAFLTPQIQILVSMLVIFQILLLVLPLPKKYLSIVLEFDLVLISIGLLTL